MASLFKDPNLQSMAHAVLILDLDRGYYLVFFLLRRKDVMQFL